jgi:beta-lactamase class A
VAAILRQSKQNPELMGHRIAYAHDDLVTYSPITKKHVADGMTVAELCAAAMEYSDNTAANLLMNIVGGPAAVTAFARSIGDREFRIDRWEPDLNTALPGDARDTSTPEAMARSLKRLALGEALDLLQQAQLCEWLRANTTGAGGFGPAFRAIGKLETKRVAATMARLMTLLCCGHLIINL